MFRWTQNRPPKTQHLTIRVPNTYTILTYTYTLKLYQFIGSLGNPSIFPTCGQFPRMFDAPGGDLRLSRIAGLGTKESGRGLEHHPTDQPTHLWRQDMPKQSKKHDVFSPTVFAFLFSSLFYSLISSLCLSLFPSFSFLSPMCFFHVLPSFFPFIYYILHGFYNFVPYRPMVFLMFCAFFCTIYSLVSALFSP